MATNKLLAVLPYKRFSRGARTLAKSMGKCRRVSPDGEWPDSAVVINWGCTDNVGARTNIILNHPSRIRAASNKLEFFTGRSASVRGYLPDFYTNAAEIPDEAFPIVCRTVLAGHSGEGIVIADTREQLVPCRLYVSYIKKQDEFRVHCGRKANGEIQVIAVQRKARRHGAEVDWRVRTHAGGFVFVRNDVHPPERVTEAATRVFADLDLDFGAVDVIYNGKKGAFVLEVNTAPGLEGQTITDYTNFFNERIQAT